MHFYSFANFFLSSLIFFIIGGSDSESPAMSLTGVPGVSIPKSPEVEEAPDDLPNQISAAYEVPQFPIEQIEKKLMLQRHLTAK